MSSENVMKLTCQGNSLKRNAYILPSVHYYELRNTIVMYLFGNGEAIKHDFRVYWIDQDNDEIDIVNQSDYDIFLKACKDRWHLYAVSKNEETSYDQGTAKKAKIDGLFPTTAVHTRVECDNCKLKPLIGFRYKCIECHDFDLCQSCEAKHVHPEHMMVRMPHADCPNLIEAWVTGRSKRSHKRSGRPTCPIMAGVPEMSSTAAPGGGDSERHHRRSHRRRDFNNGVFGHLYKIMVDLAEGGVQVNDEVAANSANAAAETAASAASTAATVAASAATTAARVAAEACTNTTVKPTDSTPKGEEAIKEQNSNTGAKAKSTKSTPSAASTNKSEPSSVPATPSLENLTQFIDPQYMRTGIEILNNFGEMFSKMLDLEDGYTTNGVSDGAANNETRKNSTISTISTNSKATSTNVEQSNVGSQASAENEATNEAPSSTVESPIASMAAASQERRRSQSLEDSDWQMVDQHASSADVNIADAPPAKIIDFAQLSKDLKAHIEEEQKKKHEESPLSQVAAAETNNVAAIPTEGKTTVASHEFPVSQNVSQPTAPPKASEEKRGVLFYHPDPRINNAVHAMIAMGFSNEGAWLTQLLESVNGSIPDALDLMSAAQRNSK